MEEESCLASLIKQRQTRPSYTRTVSLEFSNSQERKRRRRKTKISKKQSVDDEAPTLSSSSDEDVSVQSAQSSGYPDIPELKLTLSSEDDLYFSAEEEISSLSSSDGEASQQLSPLDIAHISNKSCVSGKVNNVVTSHQHHEKKGAPSKKQKRKRHKHNILDGNEILSVLEGNIYVETDYLGETQKLVEHSRSFIEKAIPSLFELCLNSIRQKKVQTPLPKGLKNIVKHSNNDLSLRKLQVSLLQNQFSQWQPFAEKKGSLFVAKEHRSHPPVYKCLLPTRNIWNSMAYPKFGFFFVRSDYCYSKTSSILPAIFVTPKGFNPTNDSYMFHQKFLGCLATLVDLMMPAFLSETVMIRKQYESESTQILSAIEMAKIRVKRALKMRFADVVDLFYDKVLPYVFWARGDLQLASTLFMKLIDGETRSRYRAMCMVEIARMHAQLGEPESACQFYRMASDIALEKGKAMKDSEEVTGQMMMLLASVYDQGMMTPDNQRKAADHWKFVVTSQDFNHGAANMAAVSMLCFHSRPGNDTEISSFEEVKWRLQEMLDVCPQYLYYISMLHALSGQGSDADATYREYLQRGVKFRDEDAPGLRMISDVHSSSGRRQQRRNIWHTLVDMVTKSGLPQPLHVLWRSHLPPLRICDPSSLYFSLAEADLCCDYLDLRLNSQGYLTGNLKMMLPPMRSINLDPYTGRLCFPQTPGRTETWTSLDKFYENEGHFYSHSDNGCIPCPLKVFHHADGTTVLMLVPSPLKRQCEFRSNVEIQKETCITLFWSDGKGQSATLNVVNILRLILFEKVKRRIRNEPILRKNSEKWQKDCFRLLKHHYDTKSLINYDDIIAAVSAYNTEREKCPKSQWNSKQLLDMNSNKSASLFWDNDYVSYGETLAFTFQFNNECISVFVDCSSRRGFLHPTIKFEPHLLKHFGEIPNCRDHDHKVVGGRIFYYPMSDRTCLMVYGERGRLIQKINCNKEDNLPYIIGSSLLRITNQKRLWCWHDRSIKEAGDTLPDVQTITPLDCSVVMVMLKETGYFRFVNVPSLETVVIRSGCDMKGIQITDNGLEIKAKFTVVKVLSNHSRTGLDHCYQEAILGMDSNLVTLQIQEDGSSSPEVVVTQVVPISGFPVEHCFVGEKSGYLLSWTQQNKLAKEYKEHVSYFSKDSELLGILPCVGTGPRSFCPLYLPGDTETQKENPGYGLPGWYVYMRDGYDGIIGVKLPTG